MEIYKKNIDYIKQKSPALYNAIEIEKPLFHLEVGKTREGYTFVNKDGKFRYLNSIYDIQNELEMMFKNIDRDTETFILFGIGNGSAADYIIKNFVKVKKIIVVEPTSQMLKEFLANVDFVDFFGRIKHITLVPNQNVDKTVEVLKSIVANGDVASKVSFISHVTYFSLFQDYYNYVVGNLIKYLRQARSLVNCSAYSNRPWFLNAFRNLMHGFMDISLITDMFKGRPVLIVSAGPSLMKNIHLINEVKKRAIVFAGGTTVKILQNQGIVPHFRVTADARPAEEEVVVKDVNTENTPLIYVNTVYSGVLENYKGIKIHMKTSYEYLGPYVYKKAGLESPISCGGVSVSNVMADFLIKAGCSKLIFVGQDMCYQNDRLYAQGSNVNEAEIEYSQPDRMYMKDIYGNEVYTINSYLNIKYDYEETIKQNPGRIYINATEGGLGIDGAVNMTLEDVLKKELLEELDFDVKADLEQQHLQHDFDKQKLLIDTAFKEMKIEIEDTKRNVEDILKIIEETLAKKSEKPKFLKKCVNDIIKLEKKLNGIDFYSEVVSKALGIVREAISLKYKNDGNDELLKYKNESEFYKEYFNQVDEYTAFANAVYEELYIKKNTV